jgi:hypothetical protein
VCVCVCVCVYVCMCVYVCVCVSISFGITLYGTRVLVNDERTRTFLAATVRAGADRVGRACTRPSAGVCACVLDGGATRITRAVIRT